MTGDFIDDLTDQLEKQGNPYVLVILTPTSNGGRVISNVDRWVPPDPKKSVREDLIQLLDATVFEK